MPESGKTPLDIVELQQQVDQLKAELRQAQGMTALGELVSTTTHEFNNILMTILNYAKIGMRHKDNATRDKSFDRILKSAQRAEKITNSVLGLARNRSNEQMPTDMIQIVEESLVLLEREMQKYRVRVIKQFEAVPPVMAAGNQLQQVLLNLMTNARQAMAQGGEMVLRVCHDPAAGTVDLTVQDSGSGIPQDELPKIFDRFFSTKDGPDATGKGGTGVGLSMCKDIIDEHKGRIRVQSTVGRGTAFTIKIPVVKTTASSGGTEGAALPKLGVPTNQSKAC